MKLTETTALKPGLGLKSILEKTPALIYVFDYEVNAHVFCSNGLMSSLGYQHQDIKAMGSRLRETLYHPADLAALPRHDHHITALTGDEVYSYSFRMLCADGQYRWFVTRVRGYEWNDLGQMKQCIGLCALLLEQDNLYNRLADEELRFRAIYNSTTDLNVFVDRHFKLLAINHTALRYIKKYYSYVLHPGDPVLQILPPRWSVHIRHCLQKALCGLNSDVQLSYATAAGTTITFRFRFFPVRSAEGDVVGVNVNASNISRLSAATQKVELQGKQLRHIAQLNAHEIRRPLTNILGIIHLLKLEHPAHTLPPGMEQMLAVLKRSADDLDAVIRNVVSTAAE